MLEWNFNHNIHYLFKVLPECLYRDSNAWVFQFNGIHIPNIQIGFRYWIIPRYFYVCLGPNIRFLKTLGKARINNDYQQEL